MKKKQINEAKNAHFSKNKACNILSIRSIVLKIVIDGMYTEHPVNSITTLGALVKFFISICQKIDEIIFQTPLNNAFSFDLLLNLLRVLKIWSSYICFSSTSWFFLMHTLSVTDLDQFSAKNWSLRLFLKVSDGKGLFHYGNAEEEHQTQY